jgi:hypothetical protein
LGVGSVARLLGSSGAGCFAWHGVCTERERRGSKSRRRRLPSSKSLLSLNAAALVVFGSCRSGLIPTTIMSATSSTDLRIPPTVSETTALRQFRLLEAVQSGDRAKLEPFLSELELPSSDQGASLLNRAVKVAGHDTIAHILSHPRVDPNVPYPEPSGTTPIHLASSEGRADVGAGLLPFFSSCLPYSRRLTMPLCSQSNCSSLILASTTPSSMHPARAALTLLQLISLLIPSSVSPSNLCWLPLVVSSHLKPLLFVP